MNMLLPTSISATLCAVTKVVLWFCVLLRSIVRPLYVSFYSSEVYIIYNTIIIEGMDASIMRMNEHISTVRGQLDQLKFDTEMDIDQVVDTIKDVQE